MCSRFSVTSPSEAVRAYFNYENDVDFPPQYNISPTDPVLVVRIGHNKKRELYPMRWGLIPSWVKDPDSFSTLINARSETAREKPSFRNAMKRRRCLIPANGFYEWAGPKGHKRAYQIHEPGRALMAFAGLWEHWLGADGTEIETVTILTREPNTLVAKIHNRMPQILPPDAFDAWLDCDNVGVSDALALLKPTPDDQLKLTQISTRINNPGNKDEDVQEPLQGQLI